MSFVSYPSNGNKPIRTRQMETKSLDKLFLASAFEDLSNTLERVPESSKSENSPMARHRRRVKQHSSLQCMLVAVEKQQENPQQKEHKENEEKLGNALEKIRLMRRMRRQILRKLALPEVSTKPTKPICTTTDIDCESNGSKSSDTFKSTPTTFQSMIDIPAARSQNRHASTSRVSSRALAA